MDEISRPRWITDANQIDAEDAEKLLYENKAVKTFLQDRTKYFIAANRGMGKTLLLTVKRYKLSEQYAQNNPGRATSIKFIPENRPFLDTLESLGWLDKQKLEFLSSIGNTMALWSVSIKLACCILADRITSPKLVSLVDALKLDISYPKPTDVFNYLLRYDSIGKLSHLIQDIDLPLSSSINQINFSINVFIDKIDQAILSFHKEAWKSIQLGLIDAAWRINENNHHIKIYAAIRQEAYVSGDQLFNKESIDGRVTVLSYDKKELDKILNKLVFHYEQKQNLDDYLGFTKLPTIARETPFDYLLRHGTYRPREFVSVMRLVSDQRENGFSPNKFIQIINEHSNDTVKDRIAELHPFLATLNDKDRLLDLVSAIPHNILQYQEIKSIFEGINNWDVGSGTQENIKHAVFHPFCELYLCGLLGVVKKATGLHETISFRQPKDPSALRIPYLPYSSYFFIHPALVEFIQTHSSSQKAFKIFRWNTVAHDIPWTEADTDILKFSGEVMNLQLNGYTTLLDNLIDEYRKGMRGADLANSKNYLAIAASPNVPKELILSIDDYLVN